MLPSIHIRRRAAPGRNRNESLRVLCPSQALTWSTRSVSVNSELRLFGTQDTETLPARGGIFAVRDGL